MANSGPDKSRTVVEPLAQLDLSSYITSPSSSIRSLSLSDGPQTLIYLGTQSGSLILLSLTPTTPNVSFLRSVSLGDSPVDCILVLGGDIGKVLVLSDGFLFLLDSLLTQPVKKVTLFKGVSVIAKRIRNNESEITNLVPQNSQFPTLSDYSSTSQRLLQKLGGGIRTNGVKTKEALTEQHRDGNAVFAIVVGKRLVLIELVFGTKARKSDQDIDILSGSFVILKEIQCVDGVRTMLWLDDSIIVGTVNGYSLFSCVTGKSGVIFTLPDVSSTPLLKFLWKEWNVLLLVDNVGIVINAHGQPVGGSLVFRRGLDCVAELSSYLVVVRDGKMDLYHKKSGTCIQTVTFGGESIGPCVAGDEENGSGKLIVVATPTKLICYRQVPAEEQIKDLLRKKNFKEAISLVEELECEGEMSKEMLSFVHAQVGFLLLFDLHFEEAVNHFLQSDTMQPSEVFPFVMRHPNRWSLLVPRNRYWGLHPPPAPLEDVVDDGLLAIQRAVFLRKAGVETAIDDDFLLNPPIRADLLESAIKNIIRYLEVSRQKELTLSVREGVDTLLMYLYRALNRVADMEKLASSENCCIVEELETLLDDSGHLRTLAFLYASKGMSSKALAIWRILAKNYSSGLWKDPAADNDFHDGSTSVISGREIAAIEGSKILEESSDQDLVLHHLGWIADVSPVLAVQILTSEKRVNLLSPDEVIAAIDPKKVEILQRYAHHLFRKISALQHLPLLKHTLIWWIGHGKRRSQPTELWGGMGQGGWRQEQERPPVERGKSGLHRSLWFLFLSHLFFHLTDSLYPGVFVLIEFAILYRKLGQETLVLQILALKLEDSDAAEQYCAEIGRPDAYMQLLDMYLDPQNGKEPMFNAAVRLLHNHGESLDPLQVLETLSPDMPLQLASDTILRMLRARLHHHRQGQIVHNLSSAVDIDAKLARLEERSRHVQINDESLCDSCHARLGTKLFAMYPDDTIVCYKCFRRQGESTSVTGRDFKQDVLIKPGWLVT
ncbi:CNH domain-containing protein/Vps39_1 domain-containing protein/Vps39_2 domain-containing protein [Cephalotus follicularis]|uniref:CNH domain-containing protein/Vps39_1 domain-containing protein/Vps39_2 domain-containing protein n=1 Tax=Cephalotus follicularis TaxID=3775 RepID=A0A1Q3B0M9_CEPFO|nr:CNH domain-containing protein/Vps39_1 domain-containing protein/Vps39_2 domain-containing protein [Cephalotus follicularis]